jgi:two-component system, OmpR family, sensor histidine kinase BaeS
MLRRLPLTLKLSLTVALAVALSTALVASTVHWSARQGFDQYLTMETSMRADPLRALLEQHYAEQGHWRNIEPVLRRQSGRHHGMGMHEGVAPGTSYLMLVDPTGQVRYDPSGVHVGHIIPRGALRSGVPLSVRGQTVGYLVTQVGTQESAYYRRLLTTILSAGAFSSLLAIGLGLMLTRTALAPLKDLEQATGQIAAGDLAARVQVQADDEVGALARRFNSMAADLQRQDKLRRRMMNDIAHELRTPVTVMQGALEALQDGVFPMDQENVQPVYEQTLLLKRLVDDMRDLALAEAGQMTLDRAPMDVGALLHRVAACYRTEAESRGVALDVTTDPALPAIFADAQRMEQVLGNLLSNALRYTLAGGTVTVKAQEHPSGLCITVQDTGEGIDPQDQPQLFERFFRGDRGRHRGDGHTGLGLAIARELVRAHGGDMTAESALGQGTTISVHMPMLGGSQVT